MTRLFATFSEIACIFLFSHLPRLLNIDQVQWVIVLSWLMAAQVVISQGFVWAGVLTEQLELYYYEELGWALIFVANTIVSAYLYLTVDALGDRKVLSRSPGNRRDGQSDFSLTLTISFRCHRRIGGPQVLVPQQTITGIPPTS